MRIGILETGAPPGDLSRVHGSYAGMVARLLGDRYSYTRYDVRAGDMPGSATACAAYIVTGSAAGVNDGLSWTETLGDFLRRARGSARLVGICFGHQMIAHAFGGHVRKAPQGWGLGLTHYALTRPVVGLPDTIAVMASHQDQVVVPPPDAETLAANGFTPQAALGYAGGDALTLQFHPEFDAAYARALIAAHTAPDIDDALRVGADASLAAPSDNAAIGAWLDRYLDTGRLP